MKKLLLILVLILLFLPSTVAFADAAGASPAESASPKPKTIPCVPSLPCINEATQATGKDTRTYIADTFGSRLVSSLLGFTGLACVVGIIIGGMQMHFAFGNEEAVTKAKKTVVWSIVGLVIAILAVAIVQIISKLEFS